MKRWFDSSQTDTHFGLSEDQWERYRQTGVYAAYRTILRGIPGFTKAGDGWSPAKQAHQLAELLVRGLGRNEQLPDLAPRKRVSGKAEPQTYWRNVWKTWDGTDSAIAIKYLPADSRDIRRLGNSEEADILADLLFSNTPSSHGERRRIIAVTTANSTASSHDRLCEDIADVLQSHTNQEALTLLAPFTRFADAALDALLSIWRCFHHEGLLEPTIPVNHVGATPGIAEALARARKTAKRWLDARRGADVPFLPLDEADALAHRLAGTQPASTREQLVILVNHHVVSGGGLRWMKVEDDRIVPTAPTRYQDASPYRFRLWQLCRLAVQCGVIQEMPKALTAERESPDEDHEQLSGGVA